MPIDIMRLIGAVTRELSIRDKDGARARVLTVSRTYNTSHTDLWDALTNPERIPRWFLPISGNLRPGGEYQLQGNAAGDILACESPNRLSLTWSIHGQVSWVTIELSANSDGTTGFALEHVAHVPDELWEQFGPGAVGIGWDQALMGLDQHYTNGETVDPEAAASWMSSEEGRSFVRLSGEAWCQASIAAGADPETARAAANRVTAMYAGAEPGPAKD